jgi:hypothetical protein
VHPFIHRDEVHAIYQEWRRIADSYPGHRVLIGEVWLPDAQRLARYLRPDELHSAFNFDFLCCAWDAGALTGGDQMTWLASPAGVLMFRRGEGPDALTVMINLSAEPVDLPVDDQVLLSSVPVTGGLLPQTRGRGSRDGDPRRRDPGRHWAMYLRTRRLPRYGRPLRWWPQERIGSRPASPTSSPPTTALTGPY